MSNLNKGVKEYRQIINYFLALDRSRGASYCQLAKLYNLDQSNIYKRINYRPRKKQIKKIKPKKRTKTQCKHGHRFKPNNETWFTDKNGKRQRKCKKCYNKQRRDYCKLRYRTDVDYREYKKANSRKNKEVTNENEMHRRSI